VPRTFSATSSAGRRADHDDITAALGAHLNTRFSTFCSTNFAALLLQQILAAKSVAFVSMHELNELFRRHSDRKDSKQRANPGAMVPGLRQHHDELEKLHDDWTDFDDGESLAAVEKSLAYVHVAASEASDTAKLIENGRKSYDEP